MASQIGSILQHTDVKRRTKLNILTFCTHERAENSIGTTGHNFYSLTGHGIRQWNTKVAPIPENYHIYEVNLDINDILNKLPQDVEIDCILAQNRFAHIKLARYLQQYLQVPVVFLEHTDTMPGWPEEYIRELSKMTGDINVFISEYSKERWLSTDGIVIEHYIDTDIFCPGDGPRQNYVLSMCNDWINRDVPCGFTVWQNTIQGFPYKVLGETPGLSKGTESLQHCVYELQQASIFLNTSQYSPIPMSLLEAMSCGCAIVSSATCMIPEIIEHGKNGFISNDVNKLREYIAMLLNDGDLAKRMGLAARQTIVDRFNQNKFLKGWHDVFEQVRNYR